jgi:large subunit ribosomal protein L10
VNRTEKEEVVALLQSELPTAASIVVVAAEGIPVNVVNAFRTQLRLAGSSYRVVKNTLAGRAVAGTQAEVLTSLLKGTSALVYHPEDPARPAKMVLDFADKNDKFVVRGAVLGGVVYDAAGVKALASMPGKDELRASLLGVLNGVGTKFVRTLAAAPTQMLNVLNARKEAIS